jgi:hypothetical protein
MEWRLMICRMAHMFGFRAKAITTSDSNASFIAHAHGLSVAEEPAPRLLQRLREKCAKRTLTTLNAADVHNRLPGVEGHVRSN